MKLNVKAFTTAVLLVLTVALASCGSSTTTYEGKYKNTDTSYKSGDSYINVSGITSSDSSSATGICRLHNVYGINSAYYDIDLTFSLTDSTSVKITSTNPNLYWTGTFNDSTKTITPKTSPLTYSYKK